MTGIHILSLGIFCEFLYFVQFVGGNTLQGTQMCIISCVEQKQLKKDVKSCKTITKIKGNKSNNPFIYILLDYINTFDLKLNLSNIKRDCC